MNKDNQNIRLLIVDDEEDFLESTSKALSRRGFVVDCAQNGTDAIKMAKKNSYDILILDVKMPDIDGIAVFRIIHKILPDLLILLLTGHSTLNDAFQTLKEGVTNYLTKPIEMDELAMCIKNVVSLTDETPDKRNNDLEQYDSDEVIRIMLIDDEYEFLESLKKVLQRRKMDVITMDSGEKALMYLKNKLVDVVVLDVKIPGMNGLEILQRIKQDFPSIEVILLTGHPSISNAIDGIRLGACEYLQKPYKATSLATTIRKLYTIRKQFILEQQQKLIEEIQHRFPD